MSPITTTTWGSRRSPAWSTAVATTPTGTATPPSAPTSPAEGHRSPPTRLRRYRRIRRGRTVDECATTMGTAPWPTSRRSWDRAGVRLASGLGAGPWDPDRKGDPAAAGRGRSYGEPCPERSHQGDGSDERCTEDLHRHRRHP